MHLKLSNSLCRNLPYLKRDCDFAQLLKPGATHKKMSKPALLKKGLRLENFTISFQNRSKSKPALLKKGLRHNAYAQHRPTPSLCRNLPYLKRDCDILPTESRMTFHKIRRNLPYLKRDCDLALRRLNSTSSQYCRNLPYLKRDCDQFRGAGWAPPFEKVETCPT